jgi:phytoene dehydrogenase-like protein
VPKYDAVVIGSGPNGFAAAITLAQAGLSVVIYEAKSTIGGGMRSCELTLPGFIHDLCSAIHPLAVASPFFRTLPLEIEWIYSPIALAHPFDDGSAAILDQSFEATKSSLGVYDGARYQKLMEPLVKNWEKCEQALLGPLRFPKHPLQLARFGMIGIQSAQGLWRRGFREEHAKALIAGLAGHSMMPLDHPLTAAFALILAALGHRVGWPICKGGSQQIASALALHFKALGGEIITEEEIKTIDQLSASKLILCDITPKQLLQIAGHRLPKHYKKRLEKYRYGPGVFKMDWALKCAIPWRADACRHSATLHLGGAAAEIQEAEAEVWQGIHPKKPFVIMAQQSLFDTTRAPSGHHTAWAYCHVPNGSSFDMTERIEKQIERFAPGFQQTILARSSKTAQEMEAYNANYVGGDINGGVQNLFQLFSRPAGLFNPYATPLKGLYLCSSSTPPGGGVHGMCGYHAARLALKSL